MEKRKTIDNRRFRESKLIVMALGLVVSIAIGSTATVAYFSDTAAAEVNVQAGSINLGIGQEGQKAYSLDLGEGWFPGKSVTREVTIHNTGTVPLKYSAKTVGDRRSFVDAIDQKIYSGKTLIGSGSINNVYIGNRTLQANSSETFTFIITWRVTEYTDFYQETVVKNSILFTAESI